MRRNGTGSSARRLAAWTPLAALLMVSLVGPGASAAPSNDNITDAAEISSLPFEVEGDTTGAGIEPLEPQTSCAPSPPPKQASIRLATVWYRFTSHANAPLRTDASGGESYTMTGVFEQNSTGALEEVACNDEDTIGDRSATFSAESGHTYFFQLGTLAGGRFRFSLDTVSGLTLLREIVPFAAAAPDGVMLRGHVYLPIGDGPFATVLEYSPYWNTRDGRTDEQTDGCCSMSAQYLHKDLLEAGFAVALVNVRGTGLSEGCMHYGDSTDRSDAAAVVEALAHEQWSNGNIGMIGLSYPGWTQYLAMAEAPPSLKAIVPISGVIDPWSLLTRRGAPMSYTPGFTPTFAGVGAVGTKGVTSPDHVVCESHADDLAATERLVATGDRSPYFEERDLRPLIRGSRIPALVVNGLAEGGLLADGENVPYPGEAHVLQFEGLWDLLDGDHRFLLGQWGHRYPKRDDFGAMIVAWFDQYLRGGPETLPPGVAEFQDDSGAWHLASSWPPPGTSHVLSLSGQALLLQPPSVAASQSFTGVGTPCVGFCPASEVSNVLPFALAGRGPRIESCVGDQAIYVSPPLQEDVLLAGNFFVNVSIKSNLQQGNVAAFLWHTSGSGLCPDPDVKEVRRAIASLRQWDDEGGRDFPVGVSTAISLKSYPFASMIPAGHRLVLAIGGESWGLLPKAPKPTIEVLSGPNTLSSLVLPIVQGSLRFEGDA